jgi:hypothetical protein
LPPVGGAQSVAASQPHVSVPGSHFVPLRLPTQVAQVPDPPQAVGWFPATHAPLEQQKPPAHAPSPPAPHAAEHAPAVHVGFPAPQTAQAAPLTPHAPFCVPATQVPAPLQQPPLHGWVASHWLEHT